MNLFHKLSRLSSSHGELQLGNGFASGIVALGLASLCFLGVLAFHFPQYLTTPSCARPVLDHSGG